MGNTKLHTKLGGLPRAARRNNDGATQGGRRQHQSVDYEPR